jgi:hypothetical protein
MAKEQTIYKKLPGKRRLPLWSHSLWYGPDHILSVESKWVSENYKRFYYQDIQAIVIRKIDYWKIINIILGSIFGIFFLLMLLQDGPWAIFFGILWGLSFPVFFLYLIWGANCETHIKTAVQIEKLPALYRLRSTARAMSLLLQRIEYAQGTLTGEDLSKSRKEEFGESFRYRPTEAIIQEKPLRDEKGLFHLILYALLSLYGIQIVADIFYNHIAFPLTSTLFSLLIGASIIIALVKQHNSSLPGQLKKTTWVSLVFMCIDFAVGYILTFALMISNMVQDPYLNNQWDMMKMISEISPFENSFYLGVYIYAASGALILGLLGLHFIFKMRTQQKEL